jgi:RNA polymerase sigma factor (sigma-70 family)
MERHELLDAAGGNGGVLLVTSASNPERVRMATIIQGDLDLLGIYGMPTAFILQTGRQPSENEPVLQRLSFQLKPSADSSDEDLVGACLRGDQDAWSVLIDKYKNLVYSVPMKYRMTPEDAADIFQSVWTELYTELTKLRSPGALRSWLITVATHKCYHSTRKSRRLESVSEPGPDVQDQRTLITEMREQLEREQMLREATSQLPPRCQEIIQLLFYKDPPLAYAELARHLGLAEGSIGFIRGRCLQRLRKSLAKMGF